MASSIGIPVFFLIILPPVMFQEVPAEVMPFIRGYLVIALITFAIMTTAISNLAGSIAADRDHGLYSKLASMPISPLSDIVGRLSTVFVYAGIGSSVVIVLGIVMGAQFTVDLLGLIQIILVFPVVAAAATGIGLTIAAFAKSESAASHTGTAIVLVIYFVGIAIPFANLPDFLRPLVLVDPISLGNLMFTAAAIGKDYVGFNPLTIINVVGLLTGAAVLFSVGVVLYLRRCWRR